MGIFPSGGPPPPTVWECLVFEKKKLWFILHFRTIGTFVVGGSPMLKTVKSGSGIWVDPPPCFLKFPHFPVFFLLTSLMSASVYIFLLSGLCSVFESLSICLCPKNRNFILVRKKYYEMISISLAVTLDTWTMNSLFVEVQHIWTNIAGKTSERTVNYMM